MKTAQTKTKTHTPTEAPTTKKPARFARGHAYEGDVLLEARFARKAFGSKPIATEEGVVSVVEYEHGTHGKIAKNNLDTSDEDKKHTPD